MDGCIWYVSNDVQYVCGQVEFFNIFSVISIPSFCCSVSFDCLYQELAFCLPKVLRCSSNLCRRIGRWKSNSKGLRVLYEGCVNLSHFCNCPELPVCSLFNCEVCPGHRKSCILLDPCVVHVRGRACLLSMTAHVTVTTCAAVSVMGSKCFVLRQFDVWVKRPSGLAMDFVSIMC